MMNFHFMEHNIYPDLTRMQENAFFFDWAKYKSVLYTFNSSSSDFFIKAANTINTDHEFKYLFAIRPYHVSPQFCAMIIRAFQEIQPDRIALNWLAGDFDTRMAKDEPNYQTDVYNNSDHLRDIKSRREFVRQFVDKLIKQENLNYLPDFVFSGFSEYSIETSVMFNGTTLSMIDDFTANKNRFKHSQKNMVAVKILLRDNEEDAKIALDKLIEREREKNYTIYGTPQQVAQSLLSLESEGVTDVMIMVYPHDPITDRTIHKMIHDINLNKEEIYES